MGRQFLSRRLLRSVPDYVLSPMAIVGVASPARDRRGDGLSS